MSIRLRRSNDPFVVERQDRGVGQRPTIPCGGIDAERCRQIEGGERDTERERERDIYIYIYIYIYMLLCSKMGCFFSFYAFDNATVYAFNNGVR